MSIEPGENFVDCDFPQLMLSAGSFLIGAGLAIPNIEWLDKELHAATFEVDPQDTFKSGFPPAATRYPVAVDHIWHIPSRNCRQIISHGGASETTSSPDVSFGG
jgi:hypothetical protein